MNRIERQYELSVVPSEGIEQLHTALASFWDEAGVAPEAQIRFNTAIAEVVANILQYAVRPGDGPIQLRLRFTPARIEARLVDRGRAWERPAIVTSLPEDWHESGRGLAIAGAILDTLQYRRFRNLNCWRLVLAVR
ncbi:ATP-binding protein [uncultured Chloroflexus sp.]|uniref:ATP-binding protein n=1 Tax=uncultured Chloroflexus sp. TaxID=214040 RepID=UPI002621E13C|nr:ATP-binding protein [uncultured Chloroflexus sp.]